VPLSVFNTYSGELEVFEPLAPDESVTIYSCGPTVYSYAHIGNMRSFLLGDLLRRALDDAATRSPTS
jgi:cysteinyl-tRNA synthetase